MLFGVGWPVVRVVDPLEAIAITVRKFIHVSGREEPVASRARIVIRGPPRLDRLCLEWLRTDAFHLFRTLLQSRGQTHLDHQLINGEGLANALSLLDLVIQVADLVLVMLPLELVHAGDELLHMRLHSCLLLICDEIEHLNSLLGLYIVQMHRKLGEFA